MPVSISPGCITFCLLCFPLSLLPLPFNPPFLFTHGLPFRVKGVTCLITFTDAKSCCRPCILSLLRLGPSMRIIRCSQVCLLCFHLFEQLFTHRVYLFFHFVFRVPLFFHLVHHFCTLYFNCTFPLVFQKVCIWFAGYVSF